MKLTLTVPWPTAAFLSGLVGSLLGTRLLQEVQWVSADPLYATAHMINAILLEMATLTAGGVGWTIWHRREGDWKVLAIEGMGTVLGTWLVLS